MDLTTLPNGTYQVAVLDMTGRLVQTHHLAGGQAHVLPAGNLPSGAYLLVITTDNLKFSLRLLKQ